MATRATVTEALTYVYGLERYGMRLGLETMTALMAALGNPHERFRSIHIAGTNGKGSTAAILESVLRAAGFRTGLYTSPHLYQFNERLQVAGTVIDDAALPRLVEAVRRAAVAARVQPTFFEFTTAMAFAFFARAGVDIALLEAGLGGQRDATNVVRPLLAIITNVGLDHTEVLGPTREAIAADKAGVIKSGVPFVTAERDSTILKYLRTVADRRGAPAYVAHECLSTAVQSATWRSQTFGVSGVMADTFTMPLIGDHQRDNAACALVAIHALREQGLTIRDIAIGGGLKSVHWEGRLDVVSERPLIIIDGAHNEPGWRALGAFIRRLPRRDVLLVGVKRGKDTRLLGEQIAPLFRQVIATEGLYDPLPARALAQALRERGAAVSVIPDARPATIRAEALVRPDGVLLITGSLYMIPVALGYFRHRRLHRLIP